MKIITVSIVLGLLLLLSSSVYSQPCNNPMFLSTYNKACVGSYDEQNPCLIRSSLTTAAAKPSGVNICPDIGTGSPSCCNQDDYTNITASFKAYSAGLIKFADFYAAEAQNFDPSTVTADILPLLNNISGIPALVQQTLLNTYVSGIKDIITNFPVQQLRDCNQGLMNYKAGLVCLSCRTDYSKYLSTSSGSLTYSLDTQTCSDLQASCSNYIKSALSVLEVNHKNEYALAQILVANNAAASVWSAFGISASLGLGYYANYSSIFSEVCPNGNCLNASCTFLARGIDTYAPTGTPGRSKKSLSLQERTLEYHSFAFSSSEKRQSSSGSSTNTYSSGGYPATTNGKSSGLSNNQSQGGAGSRTMNWIHLLF